MDPVEQKYLITIVLLLIVLIILSIQILRYQLKRIRMMREYYRKLEDLSTPPVEDPNADDSL